MAASGPVKSRIARRRYLVAILAVGFGVAALGWVLNAWMTTPAVIPLSAEGGSQQRTGEFDSVFRTAVAQMQAGDYEQALASWHRALLLEDGIVEVKVNMGFTLFELGRFSQARDFFVAGLEQNAYQANAYYGLAVVSEKMGDLEGALGAMRSYIHLAGGEQDEKFIRRARSALWEWETALAERAGEQGQAAAREIPPAE